MSQYSNAQTPTKLEVASGDGSPKDSENAKPVLFNGASESGGGAKLGAVTAGHSSKIGSGSSSGSSKHGSDVPK